MATQVFVSPGVFTSELDITFITRQVGVTTLGLVGETTKGPAFQPIFIDNYGNFQTFFGGLNASLFESTGFPQFELPYIAKSYLSQSNQLFVTRVLGFSGYYAGYSWGITLDAALNPATVVTTNTGTTYNPLITFSATTDGTIVSLVSSDATVQTLINNGYLSSSLAFLASASTGATANISNTYFKIGFTFSGASFNLFVSNTGPANSGYISGTTTGVTIHYSGQSYSDVENQIVALLRSRGTINATTQYPVFEVTGSTIIFDPAFSASTTNPLGIFSLSGFSNVQGNFDYAACLDKTQKNYLPRVLGRGAHDGKTALFLEEFYANTFAEYNALGKIRGIKQSVINYGLSFTNYQQQYQPAVTPWVVSELRGNHLLELFKFTTISDGNSANEQIKISIINIRPDTFQFDVQIRSFFDTDASPQVLEGYANCVLDPTSNQYLGRLIGTTDGVYASKSSYVLVDINDSIDLSEAFPAGFVGYPVRDYTSNSNSTVVSPHLTYNQIYQPFENVRKTYLGISDITGIDVDFFDYKGIPTTTSPNIWTGLTNGYHLDINATAATISNVTIQINSTGGTYSPIFKFDTGNWPFQTEAGLLNGPYAKLYSRKFTLVPYGGFDGWDIYNLSRTNTDSYLINATLGANGLASGAFSNRTLSNGDLGITSDYYAFLEGILTFHNPEAVNINVFATPGIDDFNCQGLVNEAITMVEEQRADSLYVITTPDVDSSGNVLQINNVVDELSGLFDSNYSCTYWPWVQINDAENNVLIFVPPTRDVVRNIALTDNIAFPWFATAGVTRGNVDCIKARTKLAQTDRDLLYENRINPIATFASEGVKIWGNKTLQVADTFLNRINVRRLLLQARKLISAVGIRLLFDQNDTVVRNQFLSLVNPILDNIRSERGLSDFRVVLSNNPEDIDNNQLTGQIFLKPTTALEFIEIQFVIMNSGASFDNI